MTRRRQFLAASSLLMSTTFLRAAYAADAMAHEHAMHDHSMHDHAHMAMPSGIVVNKASYDIPDLRLVRDDGRSVSLQRELDDGRPVVLSFIYTTCTAICPMVSQSLAQFVGLLGKQGSQVHLASISIDPEQDTPARLRAYAQRFGAGPNWNHYTGTTEASVAAQRAFDAYKGDKMSHDALVLMRTAPGQPWLRIDGFASGSELAHQYAMLTGSAHEPSH